jgi:hypothetical protein
MPMSNEHVLAAPGGADAPAETKASGNSKERADAA